MKMKDLQDLSQKDLEKIADCLYDLHEYATFHGCKFSGIASALGEINCQGIQYQIQISFTKEKRAWIDKLDITEIDLVKIHD